MITKKTEEKTNAKYDVKVNRARYIKQEEKEETISFDITVNGITIYGMIYRAGTSKNTGNEYEVISFPARKGSDNKYYNHVWFPITKGLQESIIKELEEIINEEA